MLSISEKSNYFENINIIKILNECVSECCNKSKQKVKIIIITLLQNWANKKILLRYNITKRVHIYIYSQLENNNEIYSLAQYEASKKKFEKSESLQQLPKQNNSAQNQLQAQLQQQEESNQEQINENKNLINKINSEEEIIINEQINKENETTTDIKLKQLKTVQLKLEKEQRQQFDLTGNVGNTEEQQPTLYVESLLCGGEIKPLQKVSVAASAHTATRAIFAASTANNKNCIENQYTIKPKLIDENRPKSVTASVFTPIVQLVNKQNQQTIVKLPTSTTTSTLQTIKPLNPQQQQQQLT